MLRIAHVSDLHVLSPFGFEWRQVLFNKRLTGYANLIRQRGRVYRRAYLTAVLAAAAERADHLVVTGDITNLSLEREFEEARRFLDGVARKIEVTVVPGNHDAYLPEIHHQRRFPHHFGSFLKSDLPELACDLPAGPFPCVKLRGPAALIALSSAVPRPFFVASGCIGDAQLAALERILAHPEVASRTPVVLIHHPPVDDRIAFLRARDGLLDAERLRGILSRLPRGLVLFGHVHFRSRRQLPTTAGSLDVVSATGASLDHRSAAVRAGFNSYAIGPDGRVEPPRAWAVSADSGSVIEVPFAALERLA